MNKERLLKLADHLEKGQLGHKKFDFRVLNTGGSEKNPCGTSGCAIGECPIIFPEWIFTIELDLNQNISFVPVIASVSPTFDKGINRTFLSVNEFFRINNEEATALFIPLEINEDTNEPFENEQDRIFINKHIFPYKYPNATKEEIAQHIREFVRLKELK